MKRATIKELGIHLAEAEGRAKPIAPKNLRKSLAAHGVRPGKDHKVDVQAALSARIQGKEEDRAQLGTGNTAKLKDKKLFIEGQILEHKRDVMRGEYITKSEHRMALAELCDGIVSVVENFRRRTDARHRDPKTKKILDACIAEVRNAMSQTVSKLSIQPMVDILYDAMLEATHKVNAQSPTEETSAHLTAVEAAVLAELAKAAKKLGIRPNAT
jgi:hypothetical protein